MIPDRSVRAWWFIASCLLLAVLVSPARAELWVDASAAAGGDGSAAKPFATIGEAMKAAKGGETITVRKGVYRESVAVKVSGTAERPTVLRAAKGERVVLSGFAPIAGWTEHGGGVYKAEVDGPISDLYVGYQPQQAAFWPDLDQPMRNLTEADAKSRTVKAEGLGDEPALKAVAAKPMSAMLYTYFSYGNYFRTLPVEKLDPAAGAITLGEDRSVASLKGKSGRYQDRWRLANHPAMIRRAGQWAMEKLDAKRTRVYFRPADKSELERTQYRREDRQVLSVVTWPGGVSHVRIEGLEVCGSARTGIQVERAEHVTIVGCVVHSNAGTGIWTRRSNDVQVRGNVAVANGNGISIASTRGAVVEANDVGMNTNDGIIVAGNVSGKPGGEPESENVTIRRNYVHHHLYLGHPDNMQAYRGVRKFTIDDNVLLWAGQAFMTEEVGGAALRNCVAVGTGAVAVIFGHSNSNNWTVANCTVGLGGYGAFSSTGKDYRFRGNLIWNNPLGLTPTTDSDYNVFYSIHDDWPAILVSKPKWKSYTSLAEAAEATGQEKHSLRTAPAFRSAPYCQAVASGDDANTAGRLALRVRKAEEMQDFAVGDNVEINGDGVLRRITAAEDGAIRFEPPLPRRPFRDALVWNWKQSKSPVLDLRPAEGSKALTAGEGGKPAGANLDIPAYQRGDFDGDGKRDIPELPADVKAALGDPNNIVVPLHGS